MADDWENEDFEPPPVLPVAGRKDDRWEGEDEEEPIKDSWEDEDDDKKPEDEEKAKEQKASVAKNKKKKLEEKIAEKERKMREELAQKTQVNGGDDEEDDIDLTPEERLAEKLKRQRMQEEADILMARDTFGFSEPVRSGVLDSLSPSTKEEFVSAKDALIAKVREWESRPGFSDFAEGFIRDLCATLDVEPLKKVSLMTKAFHEEKLKLTKQATKSKAKGKKVASLKVDKDDTFYDEAGGGDYDDFM